MNSQQDYFFVKVSFIALIHVLPHCVIGRDATCAPFMPLLFMARSAFYVDKCRYRPYTKFIPKYVGQNKS